MVYLYKQKQFSYYININEKKKLIKADNKASEQERNNLETVIVCCNRKRSPADCNNCLLIASCAPPPLRKCNAMSQTPVFMFQTSFGLFGP